MTFEQIKWPDDVRDPVRVEYEDLAHYVCPLCGSCWTHSRKELAVKNGQWIAMHRTPDGKKELDQGGAPLLEHLEKYAPKKIGFHIPSWLSPFVPVSKVAADFLKTLSNKTALKDWNNSHAARPWLDYTVERREDRILALKDDRPAGIVPSGGVVSCLTAGVDTQDAGFWYEIRAWGWPDADMVLDSWQVRLGFVEGREALRRILREDKYRDANGREYHVALAMQDAMGHRTAEVYNFARQNPGFLIPTQGVDTRRMASPFQWSTIEFYPGGKKAIPGGLKLVRFDANYFKNILAAKLEVCPEDPGAWRLCAGATEEWARHMCAEYIDEKTGLWACPDNRANHGWDCSVLNLLAVEVGGVKYARPEKTEGGTAFADASEGRGKEGWLPKPKGGWMKNR